MRGKPAMAVLSLAFFVGMLLQAAADQPHMQAAKSHLQNARAELNKAASDKGGHRVKAISLVNEALQEVQAEIKAGRQ